MNIIKKIAATAAVCTLTISTVVTAFAAPAVPNFTGWDRQSGAPNYYVNGTKVVNSWVKYGNTYYFLDANGYMVPNYIVNEDGVRVSGITSYIDTNNSGVVNQVTPVYVDAYAAAKQVYGVSDDYGAFKKLHPEIAALYPGNEMGLYQAYLATYPVKLPGNKYLGALQDYLVDRYNAHGYDYSYENMYNGTHKAYSHDKAWKIENCTHIIDPNGGNERCSKCGAKFLNGVNIMP